MLVSNAIEPAHWLAHRAFLRNMPGIHMPHIFPTHLGQAVQAKLPEQYDRSSMYPTHISIQCVSYVWEVEAST